MPGPRPAADVQASAPASCSSFPARSRSLRKVLLLFPSNYGVAFVGFITGAGEGRTGGIDGDGAGVGAGIIAGDAGGAGGGAVAGGAVTTGAAGTGAPAPAGPVAGCVDGGCSVSTPCGS